MPPADLPSPFDVDQLRRQAKELRAAALAGDLVARERIRRAHPRFGRTRLNDEDLATFTLRDAQLCLARELGFDGWTAVLAHAHGDPVDRLWRRWPEHPGGRLQNRVVEVAKVTGDGHIGSEHALGALLQPSASGIAAEVLAELGATWERWLERHPRPQVSGDGENFRFNPDWYGFFGFAEGLALADGANEVHDHHVLLALVYRRSSRFQSVLDRLELDPDAVVEALARRGIAAADIRPPATAPRIEGFGPRIYFPKEDASAVTRALQDRYEAEAGLWGFNHDEDDLRPFVIGEAHLDIEGTVREAVSDPATVVVVPLDEIKKRSG